MNMPREMAQQRLLGQYRQEMLEATAEIEKLTTEMIDVWGCLNRALHVLPSRVGKRRGKR